VDDGEAAMKIHVDRSAAILDLSYFLRSQTSAIVQRTAAHELEISMLGSYTNEAMAEQIGAAILTWQSELPPSACRVEIRSG
jgi:hypothetical protein